MACRSQMLTPHSASQAFRAPSSSSVSPATVPSRFVSVNFGLFVALLLTSFVAPLQEIHPVHAFLAIPDRPARPRAQSFVGSVSGSSLASHEHATPEEIRLAFLRARGVDGRNGMRSNEGSRIMAMRELRQLVRGDVRAHSFSCSYSCPKAPWNPMLRLFGRHRRREVSSARV